MVDHDDDPDVPSEDLDESYAAGDEEIDWSRVEDLAERYADIAAIVDPQERLVAAKALVAEMQG